MIDTAKFEFFMIREALSKLKKRDSSNCNGVVFYGNGFYLRGDFIAARTRINFNLERRVFWVELSLPKFVQGHNVFGTNRLLVLCGEVVKRVYARLGIELSERAWGQIKKSRIRLKRLDIACSFRVGSPGNVNAALECLFEYMRAESRNWSAHGAAHTESVYNRQHSKRVSDKFYNKYKELLVNKIPLAVKCREMLMESAKSIVRYEVTFRAAELKSLNLEFADQWNRKVVRELLISRIKRLKLSGQFNSSEDVSSPAYLNDSSKMFLGLWSKGADLHVYKNCKTLLRARSALIESCGIDVFKKARSRKSLDLGAMLSVENAIFSAPKRLVRKGLIFGRS